MQMNTWKQRARWLLLLVALAINLGIGAKIYSKDQALAAAQEEEGSPYETFALFTKVVEQVRSHYVEEDKTGYKDLIYGGLKGMLQSLDPHSQFMTPEEFKEMKEDTSGHFGGLGITIGIRDSVLTVISPMEDTPAFRAGLLSGDKIIEIDGESTDGIVMHDALKKLRGEPGTDVTIKIYRPENQEIKEHTITRAIINVASVKDARVLDGGIGYVRLTQFGEETSGELQKALDELVSQHVRALVLDLRGNPGGLLSAAVEVSQKFLKNGDLIVFTRGRNDRVEHSYRARGRKGFPKMPMAILINGGSASASEIVAGALQDNQRATLVGEKSFGKGSVQSVLPLEDSSAIRLTTAKYYTPSERVIHENGIEPDIVVPMSAEMWRDILIERNKPETPKKNQNGDDEEENVHTALRDKTKDEKPVQDIQLERACDMLKGMLIYLKKP